MRDAELDRDSSGLNRRAEPPDRLVLAIVQNDYSTRVGHLAASHPLSIPIPACLRSFHGRLVPVRAPTPPIFL